LGADPDPNDITNIWDLLNYIQQYGINGLPAGATKFLFDNNGNITDVLYSEDPYLGYNNGVYGLWIQYGMWANDGYKDDMFQVLGTSYQTAKFVPAPGFIENTPSTPAIGEDMTNPWDWLYQWNKTYNFLAIGSNSVKTYATGSDTYGVAQSNLEATANLIAIFPVGKVESVAESVASSAAKQGLTNAQLVQKAATKAETAIGGTGRFAGTAKHQYATKLLERYQKIYGDKGLKFGVYFNNGPGNIGKLDVLDNANGIIYDWKFGYPGMTPAQLNATAQMAKYQRNFGLPTQIIKP
jgi:hypothetical protein